MYIMANFARKSPPFAKDEQEVELRTRSLADLISLRTLRYAHQALRNIFVHFRKMAVTVEGVALSSLLYEHNNSSGDQVYTHLC